MYNNEHPGKWLIDAFILGGVDITLLQKSQPDALAQAMNSPESTSSKNVNLLLNACSSLTKNENFGLDMITLVNMPELGIFFYLLENADTAEQFFKIIQRYYPLFYQGCGMEYQSNGKILTLRYYSQDSDGICTRHHNEWTLGFFSSLLQRKASEPCLPIKVTFKNSRPKTLEKLYYYFGENLHFNGKYTEMTYPVSVSQLKLNHSDPVLLALLRNYAEDLLAQVNKINSFRNNVRLLISHQITTGNIKAETIAKKLAVSLSGMKRRLFIENTNFSQLRKEVTLELSQKLLIHSEASISEISNKLGYADPSAFCRMFRNAQGISPTRYRTINK